MRFCHDRLDAFWGLALSAAVAAGGGPAAAATAVDLELVLALDASGSVDDDEFALQLQGIARGFRDPAVQQAMAAGPLGQVAVCAIIWADHLAPKDTTGWYVLKSKADAEGFAAIVAAIPRRQNGATGLGEGIAAAVRSIAGNDIEGTRRTIDVSGDGEETLPRDYVVLLPQARIMAEENGITINGLAITNEDQTLAGYYAEHVISGPDSFVMAATGYEDFARAMRQKLLREIDPRPQLSQR